MSESLNSWERMSSLNRPLATSVMLSSGFPHDTKSIAPSKMTGIAVPVRMIKILISWLYWTVTRHGQPFSWLPVFSATSLFAPTHRPHSADTWFSRLVPPPYRTQHKGNNVSRVAFGRLDTLVDKGRCPTCVSPEPWKCSSSLRMLREDRWKTCQEWQAAKEVKSEAPRQIAGRRNCLSGLLFSRSGGLHGEYTTLIHGFPEAWLPVENHTSGRKITLFNSPKGAKPASRTCSQWHPLR